MSACDDPSLLSYDTAIERACAALTPISEVETVPLSACCGRILAVPCVAGLDLPPTDNSAMDGYAVRYEDITADAPLTVAGQTLCGETLGPELMSGSAWYVATGAPIPPGADTVIMQEHVALSSSAATMTVDPTRSIKNGQNIRRQGEDITNGDTLIPTGTRITPAHVAVLASQGWADVRVFRKVRVGVFSTGDELTQPNQTLELNDMGLYDSNRPTLSAALTALNAEVHDLGWVPDDADQIRDLLAKVSAQMDVIVTAGGASVGRADHLKDVIGDLGSVTFWRMAVKPGKPALTGRIGQCTIIGLPGNPTAMLIQFHVFASRLIQHAAGMNDHRPLCHKAVAGFEFTRKSGLRQWLLVQYDETGRIQLVPGQGPAKIRPVLGAAGLLVLPEDCTAISPGDLVDVISL